MLTVCPSLGPPPVANYALHFKSAVYIFLQQLITNDMDKKLAEELTCSQRLEILIELLQQRPIRPVLEKLSTPQLVQAHNFLWNKMVEFHVRTQPAEFRREDVTRKMVPSAKYQRQQSCDLRIDYCKGIECIWSNPVCAGNKVKNNMEVMAEQIGEYLFHVSSSLRLN